YRALKDPRLESLVRLADKAGKSLLYKALTQPDFDEKQAALQAFGEGGASALRKALVSRKRGRKDAVVGRRRAGHGFDLTVRYRPSMSAADAAVALKEVESTAVLLREIQSGATDASGES